MAIKNNPIKQEKLRKREELLKKGVDPYPHTWKGAGWGKGDKVSICELLETNKEELEQKQFFYVAGRLMRKRPMGKADFFNLEDEQASLQCYIRKDDFKEIDSEGMARPEKSNLDSQANKNNSKKKPNPWELWKLCDIGDILSLKGQLFKTKRGELSLRIHDLKILCKSIEALPEKYHGLEDKELKYRYRHMDLIMDQKSKKLFKTRSQIITEIRNFMNKKGFMEVETPVLQSIYGGAVAEPFETHFRRLNKKMYLKISPEIYLKKLIVGGFEKVYEIGKNFRNEGIDRTHNPEFTMMEYYEAYTDYKDQMKLLKALVNSVVKKIKGSLQFEYQGKKLNFEKWETLSVTEAVKKYSHLENNNQENLKLALEVLQKNKTDQKSLKKSSEQAVKQKNIKFLDPNKVSYSGFFNFIKKLEPKGDYQKFEEALKVEYLSKEREEELKDELTVVAFEILAEKHLWNPTFITDFPLAVSPLTKKHRKSRYKRLVERFEPYIAGMELGNAYTELNDPIDQRKRLQEQDRWLEKEIPAEEGSKPESISRHQSVGNENLPNLAQSALRKETRNFQTDSESKKTSEGSHPIDENFIHALELGMPPAGGVGLGIERLVMILTDQKSIRDCILFPALKDQS